MLRLQNTIAGTPVLSIRAGIQVASITHPIINPNNLKIVAWHVEDTRSDESLVLLSEDIREIIPDGFIINDFEVLSTTKELIRLKSILKLEFELIGLRVTTESGKRYGKIADYAFNTDSMFIHKLYASQALVKNFGTEALSIDRNQIIEVTDKRIVIEDPLDAVKSNGKTVSAGLFG
jgi:sporulation protein YlmC with PRC-barrel domain